MSTASASTEDEDLKRHLDHLSSLSTDRARLLLESDVLDSQLLLLNTVLWMKKLQHFARHQRKQPFTLRLTSHSPPSSPSHLPLALQLTNCTPVHLCTPPSSCSLLLSFHVTHLPSSSTVHFLHSLPCPHPLWAPTASVSHSLSLHIPWPASDCTASCDASLFYHLPSSLPSSPSPAAPSAFPPVLAGTARAFDLPLGRVHWTGRDLSQALRPSHRPPTLHQTVRAILTPSPQPSPPLPPSLSHLFSGDVPPAAKVAWAVALLSPAMFGPSSSVPPALYQQLVASPLQPKPGPFVVGSSAQGMEVRVEVRQVGEGVGAAVPFVRVEVADPTLVAAAHTHIRHRITDWLGAAGVAKAFKGVAAEVLARWVSALFDAHLLPRSVQLADLLSRVRQVQLHLAQMKTAMRSGEAALSDEQVEVLWERCVQRVLALYVQSRRAGTDEPSSLEGAVLVV